MTCTGVGCMHLCQTASTQLPCNEHYNTMHGSEVECNASSWLFNPNMKTALIFDSWMHYNTRVALSILWHLDFKLFLHCICTVMQWATVTMVMRVRQGVMCSDRILRHWRNLISHSAHRVSLECGGELWGGEICDEIEISKCLWPTYLLNQSQQASMVPLPIIVTIHGIKATTDIIWKLISTQFARNWNQDFLGS